jgi:hypothetical protein
MSDSDTQSYSSDKIERDIIANFLSVAEQNSKSDAVKSWIKCQQQALPKMGKVSLLNEPRRIL